MAAPAGWTPMGAGEVTPAMQQWAKSLLSQPRGYTEVRIFPEGPIGAQRELHTYTVNADGTKTPGNYEGVTLYHAPAPAVQPPESTDLSMVLLTAAALAVVVGLFVVGLRAVSGNPLPEQQTWRVNVFDVNGKTYPYIIAAPSAVDAIRRASYRHGRGVKRVGIPQRVDDRVYYERG